MEYRGGGAIGFINKFINSEIEGIYWFFPVIFSVYLAMPVLSLLKDNRKILFYLAGTGFVLKSFLPEFLGYFGIHWNGYIAMDMLGGYLLYAVIGYLAATTDFTKKQRAAIYVAGFLGAALRYVVTLCFSFKNGIVDHTMFSYNGYYTVFLALAVFVFIKYSPICDILAENPKAVSVLKIVSSCSLGVYLIHMFVYRFLARFMEPYGWEWRVLVPIAIYLLSLGITYLLKKIPIVKYIVP